MTEPMQMIKLTDSVPALTSDSHKLVPAHLRESMGKAREFYEASLVAQGYVLAFQALAGYELLAVRHALGETRGRKSKQAALTQASASAIFDQDCAEPEADEKRSVFDKIAEAYGISRSAAYVFMGMAKKARERFDFLRALPLIDIPPSKMKSADRDKLITSLQQITDGYTQGDFLELLGMKTRAALPPSREGKRPGRKQTKRERQAQDMRIAWSAFISSFTAGHFHLLDDEELTSMEEQLANGARDVGAVLKKRRK